MDYPPFYSRVLVLCFTLLLLVNNPPLAYGQHASANSNLAAVPTMPKGALSPTTATFPFFDDFEASGLAVDWSTNTSGTGVAEISTDNPHSGTRHIFLGQKVVDDGHASLVLSINLANQPDVFLDFWWRATGNVSPVGNASRSGVYISEDNGITWKKIRYLTGNAQSYNHELINLVTAAAAQGLTLKANRPASWSAEPTCQFAPLFRNIFVRGLLTQINLYGLRIPVLATEARVHRERRESGCSHPKQSTYSYIAVTRSCCLKIGHYLVRIDAGGGEQSGDFPGSFL